MFPNEPACGSQTITPEILQPSSATAGTRSGDSLLWSPVPGHAATVGNQELVGLCSWWYYKRAYGIWGVHLGLAIESPPKYFQLALCGTAILEGLTLQEHCDEPHVFFPWIVLQRNQRNHTLTFGNQLEELNDLSTGSSIGSWQVDCLCASSFKRVSALSFMKSPCKSSHWGSSSNATTAASWS